MKKLMLIPIMLLAVMPVACDRNDGNRSHNGNKEVVYTGTFPAADVSGIHYTLHLDYDDDHNYNDGDYRMYTTYVNADTAALTGTRDLRTIRSEGDFTVENGIPSNPSARYIKLIPDVKDSGPGASGEPVYFEITSDSTLVMLNSQLGVPERPADYTLTAR